MNIGEIFKQHKTIVSYIIFGVLTTAVNFICYLALYRSGLCTNVTATVIAWITATVFAFVTNKLFVFKSYGKSLKALLCELGSFYLFRIATGIADVLIMWISVDVLLLDAALFKLISNTVVIVINYLASKLVIFKKN